MAAAATDLTTLANLKAFLSNPGTNDDTLLQSLLTNASLFIENYINRDIVSLTYNVVIDGTGSRTMVLSDYPVTAVTSVTIDGDVIPPGSVTTSGFYFNADKVILNGYYFNKGYGNVAITYTAGYATVPYDLQQACIGLVQFWLNDRQRAGEVSRTMGGQTITFSQKDMPPWVATILAQWKKVISF